MEGMPTTDFLRWGTVADIELFGRDDEIRNGWHR